MLGVSKEALIDRLPQFAIGVSVNVMGAWYRLRRYTPFMRRIMEDWRRLERIPLKIIETQQLERLRYILRCAQLTPFYNRQFQRARIDPERITSLKQLEELPLLERQDLDNYFDELIVPAHGRAWIDRKSSGTTGQAVRYRQPKLMAYDQCYAMLYGFYRWHGALPLCRRATLAGRYLGRRTEGVTAINYFEHQLLLGVHALTVSNVEEYIDALTRFRPELLQGHPSALRLLVDLAQRAGLELPTIPCMTFTGETLLDNDRTAIMKAFGGILFGTYGSGENCVAAGECEHLNGYHAHPMIGYTELLNTGEVGREIVGTSLLNDVMPLIRYRTGDLATELDRQPCSCGRSWPRLKGILGRIDDQISGMGGESIIPVMLRTDVGKRFKDLPPYTIVQHAVRGCYSLRVFIDSENSGTAQFEPIRNYLEKRLGPGAEVGISVRPYSEFLTRRAKHKIVLKE
jgi:phenylacetate-CoA ligase